MELFLFFFFQNACKVCQLTSSVSGPPKLSNNTPNFLFCLSVLLKLRIVGESIGGNDENKEVLELRNRCL